MDISIKKHYRSLFATALTALFWAISATGQTTQTPPAARPRASAAKPASPIDSVIQLVKSGMSEGLIIKTLQKQNKAVDLTPADLVKLKNAGVSENIIGALMDPASASVSPAATAAPAPATSAAPAAVVNTPTPATATAPANVTPIPASHVPNTAPVANAMKKRVIVDEFDYSAVKTGIQAVFGTQQDIGKGIRAMLTTRLGQKGKVVIVERAKINTLMLEQDRNASNRVKQGTGAKIGRINGADALLTGDITIFGRDDKGTKVKGGGIFGAGIGAAMAASKKDKAVVAIAYRIIDAETSDVIATGEARGESVRKSNALGALGGAFGTGAAGVQVDMTSSNFAETIIGEATQDCVNKLADIMDSQMENMKKTQHDVEALVADVSGNTLVISAGANDGVMSGDVFEVLRVVREVKDPVTKEVLDRITEKVGEMTIGTVRDKIATGAYVGSAPQVGFVARKKIS